MASRRGKPLIRYASGKERIEKYLNAIAPVSHFWIAHGLAQHLGADDQTYILMDDDDDRVEARIAYLESVGSPVFTEQADIDAYSAQLKV